MRISFTFYNRRQITDFVSTDCRVATTLVLHFILRFAPRKDLFSSNI